jgi:hypothetical protein
MSFFGGIEGIRRSKVTPLTKTYALNLGLCGGPSIFMA